MKIIKIQFLAEGLLLQISCLCVAVGVVKSIFRHFELHRRSFFVSVVVRSHFAIGQNESWRPTAEWRWCRKRATLSTRSVVRGLPWTGDYRSLSGMSIHRRWGWRSCTDVASHRLLRLRTACIVGDGVMGETTTMVWYAESWCQTWERHWAHHSIVQGRHG